MMKNFLQGIFFLTMLACGSVFAAETKDQSLKTEAKALVNEIFPDRDGKDTFRKIEEVGKIKNILSIDGGGLKSLISIQILKRLEDETGKKAYELFQVMGGTNLGGIIAVCSALFRMTMPEIEKLFLGIFAKHFKAFPNEASNLFLSEGLTKRIIYTMEALTELRLRDKKIKLLDERISKGVKFLLVAAFNQAKEQDPYLYRNYKIGDNTGILPVGRNDATLMDAIENILRSPEKRSLPYVDAGLIAYNPVEVIFKDAEETLNAIEGINSIVSIGSGSYTAGYLTQMTEHAIASKLKNAEIVHDRFKFWMRDRKVPIEYVRFNTFILDQTPKIEQIEFLKIQGELATAERNKNKFNRMKISLLR